MSRVYAAFVLAVALTGASGQTVDEVIALVKGGLSEETIRTQIEVTGTRYTLEPAQLVALKEGGVPESLIQAMIRTGGSAPAARTLPTPAVDAELDRQIADVRAALREPRYDLDRWNHPGSWYWDEGYPYTYGYGYPVLGFSHVGTFVGRGHGFHHHHGFHHGGFSPGFVYRRGSFGFAFGTHFSHGGGSHFRFRFR